MEGVWKCKVKVLDCLMCKIFEFFFFLEIMIFVKVV